LNDLAAEARAFADSVAGVLDRLASRSECELATALDELGWLSLARDGELVWCAGLAGVELGRRLVPVREVDRLLGGGLLVGELVRSAASGGAALTLTSDGAVRRQIVLRDEAVPSAAGLDVSRVLELGEPELLIGSCPAVAAWIAASVGYLAGLGQAALELTIDYVRGRRAFGTTLAALAPVQQLLADAATAVRGVSLLAAAGPDADALAYAGPAVAEACEACHQVSGAIGFTLEYPLHRYTERARALAAWNDALLDGAVSRSGERPAPSGDAGLGR
jgi:hypothetical protein